MSNLQCIWKYPLPTVGAFDIEMPANAHVLSVGMQGELPVLWSLVWPDNPTVRRSFYLAATGERPLPDDCVADRFVGSVLMMQGILVFHLFDCEKGL